MAALVKKTDALPQEQASLPIATMIERILVDPAISVERVNQAFDFYERVKAADARKAFDEALSAAKAELPAVVRNRTGHQNKRYADFSAFAKAIDPVFSKHGLTYRFRTRQDDKAIHVTCVLSHVAGHYEENSLCGPADTTGSKNAIQAIGSTLTYLQRYLLGQAAGVAASEDDDGASAAGDGTISDEQQEALKALVDRTNTDIATFLKLAKADHFGAIRSGSFDVLHNMLQLKLRRPDP